MNLLKAVAGELLGMFVADAPVTLALLLVMASAAALVHAGPALSLVGGAVLAFGTLAVLLLSVRSAAARSAR